MSLIFTQTYNELLLDYSDVPVRLKMTILGTFEGEVYGNTRVEIKYEKMEILFLENPVSLIMKYKGRVRFKNISAFNAEGNRIKVKYVYKSDEWQNITDTFSTSNTKKWVDYNKTNKDNPKVETIVFFEENNNLFGAKKEGRNFVGQKASKDQLIRLQKLRGNYDTNY